MKKPYQSNNNIVYACNYHVIWCTKYRRKVLVDGIADRCKELIRTHAIQYSIDILTMEVMPEHIHLLISVDPQFGIHKAVRTLKGYTSRILRKEFSSLTTKLPTLWTNSYFVCTVGELSSEIVQTYIENQKTSQRQKDKMG